MRREWLAMVQRCSDDDVRSSKVFEVDGVVVVKVYISHERTHRFGGTRPDKYYLESGHMEKKRCSITHGHRRLTRNRTRTYMK
jgi:hypothetical protein